MRVKHDWYIARTRGKIIAVSDDMGDIESCISSSFDKGKVEIKTVTLKDVFELSSRVKWGDLLLKGTDFQMSVWKKLFELSHPSLPLFPFISYSGLAESIGKATSVRAVAHVVGLNPIPVIIPCHLVLPKDCIVELREIYDNSFFGIDAILQTERDIDYGEFRLGRGLKKDLLMLHINKYFTTNS